MNRLFSKIAPKSNLLFSTNTYCKILSARNQTAVNIPSNLKLVHENVIHEEIKNDVKIFSKDLYMFPQLLSQIPSSIPVAIFNAGGKYTEQPAHIDKKIFGVAIRKDIVHEVIRYQRHKARQPKKTKRMSEISGSNKKPRPQKGGGQSQAGHKRNSVWRGGQKAHGPVLRDYSISLNRKFKAMGMMIVLAAKLREGNLVVFDKIECEVRNLMTNASNSIMSYHPSNIQYWYNLISIYLLLLKTHKTKELKTILSSHGLNEPTTVLIVDGKSISIISWN